LILNGYSDWRLPSEEELEFFYKNFHYWRGSIGGIGGFQNGSYWSSTEGSTDNAWSFHFGSGYAASGYSGKDATYRVRAVRAF